MPGPLALVLELWYLLPQNNFLLSNLYAALMQSCLGGLTAAAVGSPVLFLTPTLLLVQALASKSLKMSKI